MEISATRFDDTKISKFFQTVEAIVYLDFVERLVFLTVNICVLLLYIVGIFVQLDVQTLTNYLTFSLQVPYFSVTMHILANNLINMFLLT